MLGEGLPGLVEFCVEVENAERDDQADAEKGGEEGPDEDVGFGPAVDADAGRGRGGS